MVPSFLGMWAGPGAGLGEYRVSALPATGGEGPLSFGGGGWFGLSDVHSASRRPFVVDGPQAVRSPPAGAGQDIWYASRARSLGSRGVKPSVEGLVVAAPGSSQVELKRGPRFMGQMRGFVDREFCRVFGLSSNWGPAGLFVSLPEMRGFSGREFASFGLSANEGPPPLRKLCLGERPYQVFLP